MASLNRLTLLVGMGLGLSGTMISGSALSQDDIIEEVYITGSRLSRAPQDHVGPMNVIDASAFETTNASNLNEILRELPIVSLNGTNRNNSNGGKGAEFIDVRGLKEERTLVLINGRRAMPGILDDTLAVDLNSIPVSMIERVEVLGDGASAVYGSDAVAGVVNIILKENFEGLSVEIGGGISSESDSESSDFSVIAGKNFERGNISFGLTFTEIEGIDRDDRSWSEIPVVVDFGGFQILGSGTPPAGRVSLPGAGGVDDLDVIFQPDGAANYQAYDSSKHWWNYNTGTGMVAPSERINALFDSNFELSDKIKAKVQINYSRREGDLVFTAPPISGSAGQYTDLINMPTNNSFIPGYFRTALNNYWDALDAISVVPADRSAFQMSWRSQDVGPRHFFYDSDTYQLTAALEGIFDNGWNWDAHFSYGESQIDVKTENQIDLGNLRTALDPAACTATPGCVPVNIFGRGNITPAMADYIAFDDEQTSKYEKTEFAFSIDGAIAELEAGPLGFATGIEYRKEEGSNDTSAIVQAGNSAGNFAEPTRGDYDVFELFAESNIPLSQSVSIDAALRYSDYETIGSDTTYKLGFNWQPVEDLRFRAVASTAFRAPNVMELFGGEQDSFDNVSDPCSNYAGSGNASLIANCTAQGVPGSYAQTSSQLRISKGGNTELEAETADSFTVGLVLTPSFIENLAITVDYYDIEIDNAIGTPLAQDIINRCYTTPGLNNTECDRIARNTAGQVVRFDQLLENLAKIETSGVDLTTRYNLETGLGDLEFDWAASYLSEYVETTNTGFKDDRTGTINGVLLNIESFPRWRSRLAASLSKNDWQVTLKHRYIHSAKAGSLAPSPPEIHDEVDAMHYFDLSAAYQYDNMRFIVGIENLSDQKPEYISEASVTSSNVYDWIGRYYFARIKMNF